MLLVGTTLWTSHASVVTNIRVFSVIRSTHFLTHWNPKYSAEILAALLSHGSCQSAFSSKDPNTCNLNICAGCRNGYICMRWGWEAPPPLDLCLVHKEEHLYYNVVNGSLVPLLHEHAQYDPWPCRNNGGRAWEILACIVEDIARETLCWSFYPTQVERTCNEVHFDSLLYKPRNFYAWFA